ncbi:MAG: DUF3857 domain-containing protein, partial [Betaproteobacteria bacterium]|nr:DUF3857 domain-containing protein [Betaproteobacteria bacterium]
MLRTMTHIVASAALTLALPLSAALPVVAWAAPQDRRAADQSYQGPYTVVREHHRLHVHANGSSEHELTFELRVDTEEGVRLCGQREVDFNQALEEVKVLEAYTVVREHHRLHVHANGSSEHELTFELRVDTEEEVGARLVYRFRSTQHTPDFPGHFASGHYYAPHLSYESSRLDMLVDAGIDMGVWSRGMQGGPVPAEPSDPPGSRRYRLEYTGAAQHALEPNMVASSHFAPGMSVSSFRSFADVARAYQQRARPQAEPTATITQLARGLVQGIDSRREQVRVLYEWVSRNIRYVGVYEGVGGLVPHNAQSVLDNRYGDCKDHVVLLEAMLRAIGVESSPVLVHAGVLHVLPELPTPWAFNHAITYVPELDLFLDATAEFAPMGALPGELLGQPALITATGETRTLPRK